MKAVLNFSKTLLSSLNIHSQSNSVQNREARPQKLFKTLNLGFNFH